MLFALDYLLGGSDNKVIRLLFSFVITIPIVAVLRFFAESVSNLK